MEILRSSVRLPSDILVELGELTGHAWNSWELEPIICDAIRDYMRPQAQAPVRSETTSCSPEAGYQWKQLFLPEGTRLRAAFGGAPYFALVQGAAIQCGDQTLTPSGFANLRGSGNRNAWKAVWLRFPGNEQWVLAEVCRAKQKIAISRLFGAGDGETEAASPAAAQPRPPGSAVSAPTIRANGGRERAKQSKRDNSSKHGKHGEYGKRRKQRKAARRRPD